MKDGFLRGVLGAYVFRVVNNEQRVSLKPLPGTVKQTEGTKRASGTFGMASSLNAKIRKIVSTQISHLKDWSFTNRLNSSLMKILNACSDPSTKLYNFEQDSFNKLQDLEYNVNVKVESLMMVRPEISIANGQLTVDIPDLSIPRQLKFPGDTFQCKLSFYVSLFRLKAGFIAKIPDKQQVIITREKEFLPRQELFFEVPDGCLCVVSLFMEYSVPGNIDWEPITSKMFNPGCIFAALITPGFYQEKKRMVGYAAVLRLINSCSP